MPGIKMSAAFFSTADVSNSITFICLLLFASVLFLWDGAAPPHRHRIIDFILITGIYTMTFIVMLFPAHENQLNAQETAPCP